jgi:hypothetical protein
MHAFDVLHVLNHARGGHEPRVCAEPRDCQVPRELELVRQLGPILSKRIAHLPLHAVGQDGALREHVADDDTISDAPGTAGTDGKAVYIILCIRLM